MTLGRYDVLGTLGQGGMGVVLRGRAPDGSTVAIKVLKERSKREAFVRFDRERRLLAELDQAGFVPLLDAGESEQGPYIVMPLLEGGTLRSRLDQGPLSVEDAVALATRLARALGRAHALGIVHRDVKPENVLFDAAGAPFVADLGLAKHFAASASSALSVALSKTGEFRGTAGYMPPEQMDGRTDVGPEVDVFALGAVLHECITGKPPFSGDNLFEVFDKVRSGSARRLPGRVGAVVARALSLDPSKRYADGEALAQALEAKGGRSLWPLVLVPALVLAALAPFALGSRGKAAPDVAPVPSAAPAVPVAAEAPRPERRADRPDWYLALPADERPSLPLPKNLSFGERPGEYVNKKEGSVLVYVPATRFVMGTLDADSTEEERPPHRVELSSYFVGKYELTNEKWAAFVQATGLVTLAEKQGVADWRKPQVGGAPCRPDHPVVNVNWAEARAYCTWAGLRLPTEAEWECAARWDRKRGKALRYSWGDEEPGPGSKKLGNVADETFKRARPEDANEIFAGYEDGYVETAPVGSFPLGVSPVGALDMTGNVAEWCEDQFDASLYQHSPPRDPIGKNSLEDNRVARGGSWRQEHWRSRASYRNYPPSTGSSDWLGFRVAGS